MASIPPPSKVDTPKAASRVHEDDHLIGGRNDDGLSHTTTRYNSFAIACIGPVTARFAGSTRAPRGVRKRSAWFALRARWLTVTIDRVEAEKQQVGRRESLLERRPDRLAGLYIPSPIYARASECLARATTTSLGRDRN